MTRAYHGPAIARPITRNYGKPSRCGLAYLELPFAIATARYQLFDIPFVILKALDPAVLFPRLIRDDTESHMIEL